MVQQPLVGQDLLLNEASPSQSDTLHSTGLLWTSDQPDVETSPDNTRHSQEKNLHASGGIRTHNPSKLMAADPCLRPCGHWILEMVILRILQNPEMHSVGQIRNLNATAGYIYT
jgi:hypothetical protein